MFVEAHNPFALGVESGHIGNVKRKERGDSILMTDKLAMGGNIPDVYGGVHSHRARVR